MQINETLFATRINTKYLVIEAAMAVMLIGGTAIATNESAFAGGLVLNVLKVTVMQGPPKQHSFIGLKFY